MGLWLRSTGHREGVATYLWRRLRPWLTTLGRGRLSAARRGAVFFQPANTTCLDRHPALFALVAARLVNYPAPRLLSFGCSTGEEAFTLLRYLPAARIDAVDANPACIKRARSVAARTRIGGIRFACADKPDPSAGPYEAVFCLSVLRHGDLDRWHPSSSRDILSFARFEAVVTALDACVRPGGLLVLWGCNFRFEDTAIAARYVTIAVPSMPAEAGAFYGFDDRLLSVASCHAFVFEKSHLPNQIG